MTSTPTLCQVCGREQYIDKPRQPDMSTQVFICNRGGVKTVKVQLELSQATLDAYKERAKSFQGGRYSPKQIMENMLRNWIDGVCAND